MEKKPVSPRVQKKVEKLGQLLQDPTTDEAKAIRERRETKKPASLADVVDNATRADRERAEEAKKAEEKAKKDKKAKTKAPAFVPLPERFARKFRAQRPGDEDIEEPQG
jgi:DNA-binding GntR family transcriptional regulator